MDYIPERLNILKTDKVESESESAQSLADEIDQKQEEVSVSKAPIKKRN